jgi:hypothetical protein
MDDIKTRLAYMQRPYFMTSNEALVGETHHQKINHWLDLCDAPK